MNQPLEEPVPDVTRWLTTSQVARCLGVSPTRVFQLAKQGRLPHIRVAHGVRLFDPQAVAIEANKRAA